MPKKKSVYGELLIKAEDAAHDACCSRKSLKVVVKEINDIVKSADTAVKSRRMGKDGRDNIMKVVNDARRIVLEQADMKGLKRHYDRGV